MGLKSLCKKILLHVGIKSKLILKPVTDLISTDDEWESTGIDPAFLIKGHFVPGWNILEWESFSSVTMPVKIYWDNGTGFSESNSKIFATIDPIRGLKRNFIYIAEGTIGLRIDPGEEKNRFILKNVSIRKVPQVWVAFYTLKNYSKTFNAKQFLVMAQKGLHILRTEGFIGIKNKIKFLNSNNLLNDEYQTWVNKHQLTHSQIKQIIHEIECVLTYKPLISIILPVYNVEETWLRKCIESVINQLYPHWELCIADDASTKSHIRKVLNEYTEKDNRVKVIFREKNGHISESSNSALEIAVGEYIGLLDHDDELTIDALYENVKLLNNHPEADLIYSDEDKISPLGERHTPFFKPDWSPDLLLSHMYICHFSLYRKKIVDLLKGFRKGFEGSQDYDLALRFTERTEHIHHIPKVLYHWRSIPESTSSQSGSKNYTHFAGKKALEEALLRRNILGKVEDVFHYSNIYNINYEVMGNPLVSIIIPTKDMAAILDKCLDSIYLKTEYKNYEIILINNGSLEKNTQLIFDKWSSLFNEKIKIVDIDIPFNYSRLNNIAINQYAKGEYILLLNNDVEIIQSNWLSIMLSHAQKEYIGAVGVKLLYLDRTIQHAGVIMGLGGIAGHAFRTYDESNPGYMGSLIVTRNYSVVTAACLLMKKELYLQVGGLEEKLAVAFNDVDLCLKLVEKNYYNVCLNNVTMFHYESKTRGQENTPEKIARFNEEIRYMKEKWGHFIDHDPFYNPNLSLLSDNGFRLKIGN